MANSTEELKWYQKKITIYLFLFFLFPIGVILLWNSDILTKKAKWISTAIFAILFVFIVTNNDPKSNKSKEDTSVQTEPSNTSKIDTSLSAQLDREIISLKNVDFSQYRKDQTSMVIGVVLFKTYANLIKEAYNSKDSENIRKAKLIEGKVKALQIKEFPKLRMAYYDNIQHGMWEQDIDVKISGKSNQNLEFVGAIFASNKNKQEAMNMAREIIENLRFKRVIFKWYKDEDEYTYYDLKTPIDSKIE